MTPTAFGKYVVVEVIGRGGMANVYRARHPALDRDVAIKAIHPHLAEEPGFGERFVHEARLVASLRHPGIVQVHDFDVADGRPYMVMEYVDGGTLKDRLARARAERGRMSLEETAGFLLPIADALDYAHARGAVHRDLKPANILLTDAGAPVLSDFGIAKILEDAAFVSATGSLVGTPAYMSPEQAAGRRVDARTDQYSLGVVLYEMTTGRVPFSGESPTAVMVQHLQEPPPAPRLVNPDLPPAVEAVVLRALAKDPDARFASAGEMARAFVAAVPEMDATIPAAAAGAGTAVGVPATVGVPAAATVAVSGAGAFDPTLIPAASALGTTVVVPGAASGGGEAAAATLVPRAAATGGGRALRPAIAGLVLVVAGGAALVAGAWWLGRDAGAAPSPSATVAGGPGAGSGTPAGSDAGASAPVVVVPSPAVPSGPASSPSSGSVGAVDPSVSLAIPSSSLAATPSGSAGTQAPPSATPIPSNPAVVKAGKCPSSKDSVIYRADFAQAGAGWPVRKDGKVLVAFTDGAYHVTVIEPYHWWSAFYEPTGLAIPYAVQLRAWPAKGPGTGEYGIYFAALDKGENFELEVRDTGEYRVVKTTAGEQVDLVPWTATGRLNPGAPNTLAVAIRGKVATVCINGTAVTAVTDPDLRAGRVGMVAESEAEKLDVMFDDFTLWTLR